jgi:hypothetical protein
LCVVLAVRKAPHFEHVPTDKSSQNRMSYYEVSRSTTAPVHDAFS